jgi:hypothetical protein
MRTLRPCPLSSNILNKIGGTRRDIARSLFYLREVGDTRIHSGGEWAKKKVENNAKERKDTDSNACAKRTNLLVFRPF